MLVRSEIACAAAWTQLGPKSTARISRDLSRLKLRWPLCPSASRTPSNVSRCSAESDSLGA